MRHHTVLFKQWTFLPTLRCLCNHEGVSLTQINNIIARRSFNHQQPKIHNFSINGIERANDFIHYLTKQVTRIAGNMVEQNLPGVYKQKVKVNQDMS